MFQVIDPPRPFDPAALGAPLDLHTNGVKLAETIRYSLLIADRASVSDIEVEGICCQMPGSTHRWYDVRPMLDSNEHSAEFIDLNEQSIAYAVWRGLVARHADLPHYVRILARR